MSLGQLTPRKAVWLVGLIASAVVLLPLEVKGDVSGRLEAGEALPATAGVAVAEVPLPSLPAGFAPVPPTPTTTTEPQARAAAASAPAGPTLPDSGIIFDAVTLLTAKFWRKVCNANLLQDYVKVLDAAGQPLSPETPGPAFTTRAIAIQFLSMYDAYAGINGLKMYTKTLTPPTVPAGKKLQATWTAVAQAAHDTGVALWKRQTKRLDGDLARWYKLLPPSQAGSDWGKAVAKAVLDARANDSTKVFDADFKAPGRYVHGKDPPRNPTTALRYAPQWGNNAPFVFKDAPRLPDPKLFTSQGIYVPDYNFIKDVGKDISTTRTRKELLVGVFWAYDGMFNIGVPPRLYQQAIDAVLDSVSKSPGNRAKVNNGAKLLRIYALTAVVMADSCTRAWFEKYDWDYWRPTNGIRFTPAVPSTTAIPSWLPFGIPQTNADAQGTGGSGLSASTLTPQFPAYPSGHATMGTAIFEALKLQLGLNGGFTFSLGSDELNGKTVDKDGGVRPNVGKRSFTIDTAIKENKESRAFLGVHWKFDSDFGGKLGGDIAKAIHERFLQ